MTSGILSAALALPMLLFANALGRSLNRVVQLARDAKFSLGVRSTYYYGNVPFLTLFPIDLSVCANPFSSFLSDCAQGTLLCSSRRTRPSPSRDVPEDTPAIGFAWGE